MNSGRTKVSATCPEALVRHTSLVCSASSFGTACSTDNSPWVVLAIGICLGSASINCAVTGTYYAYCYETLQYTMGAVGLVFGL